MTFKDLDALQKVFEVKSHNIDNKVIECKEIFPLEKSIFNETNLLIQPTTTADVDNQSINKPERSNSTPLKQSLLENDPGNSTSSINNKKMFVGGLPVNITEGTSLISKNYYSRLDSVFFFIRRKCRMHNYV